MSLIRISANKKLTGLASRSIQPVLVLFFSLLLVACGGSSGGSGDNNNNNNNNTGGPYSVSVTVSGLTGSGLQVGITSDAGIEAMSISANGTRSFALALPSGSLFAVGIISQPGGQSCTVGGSYLSTSISSNMTATVTCTDTKTVGGTISGLSGSVTLMLNGTNSTSFTTNGGFVFSNQVAIGNYYAVTVGTQPAGQTCLVANSGGQMGANNISNITVTCSTTVSGYRVGGYISGISGLVVLKLNGSEELARTYDGAFTFATPLTTGMSYAVTVPTVASGYVCQVVNGTGVIANSNYPFVDIDCQRIATDIRPQVDPDGAYLDADETLTLTLNATEDMLLDRWDWSNVAFNTVLSAGSHYTVTVKTPPAGETCVLHNSVGVIQLGVTPLITIHCVAATNPVYTIGGTVSGLTGSGLVLSLDGRDSLSITAGATSYVFPNAQPNNTGHTVSIKSQPAGQICSVTNDTSWIFNSNVGNAGIICSAGPYSIGGYAAGVTATGLSLQLNNVEVINVPAGGSFVFNTLFSNGMDYDVSILSQPANQVCDITYAAGSINSTSISNIIVDCHNIDYSVAAHVAGYTGSIPLLLQLNGGEIIEATGNTSTSAVFTPRVFTTRLDNGAAYHVTIAGQSAGQSCTLTNPAGTINAANVTNVGVYCTSNAASNGPYSVSVTTSGLLGSGLVLQLNGANNLTIANNGYATFATTLANTSAYTVSVLTQPTGPIQYCRVINGTGNIASTNVTQVSVQCGNAVLSRYPVNGGKWLQYVKDDGIFNYAATDTACNPAVDTGGYDVCLNGGEFMKVAVPALASCANVTATDNLGAFDWVCDESNGVHLMSVGLKTGKSLSDLIDFTTAKFKPNYVSVFNTGVAAGVTQSAVWWSNPVRVNNTGDYVNNGEIHLITGSAPVDIVMRSNTAVLVQPGYALGGSVSAYQNTSQYFLWFEGDIDGASDHGLSWYNTRFSLAQNIQSINNVRTGVYISGNNNLLRNIVANNNTENGIEISGNNLSVTNLTGSNNFGSYGVSINTGSSTISNIVASDNANGTGLSLATSGNINLSNVTATNNGAVSGNEFGIIISGGFSNYVGPHTFSNLTANGNNGSGIYAQGLTNSTFTNITANNNTYRGIDTWEGANSPLTNISASGNGDTGIYLSRWDSSSANQVIAANNGLDGFLLEQTDNFKIRNVMASNNARNGFVLDSSNAIISTNVTATNNTGSGIFYQGGSTGSGQNIMIGATSANNGGDGFNLTRMDHVQFSSSLALNNGGSGINTYTFMNYVTMSNLVTANNTGYGFNVGSSYGHYTGLLEM
ncbi:MAG: right-handed parallel beta-helix repeat-containing protein, partial [Gammaproteobacteria bacterium]|nr:right-handed parallel beta-helix repeat-containing protein [Gammaproteobacteria bacterium]